LSIFAVRRYQFIAPSESVLQSNLHLSLSANDFGMTGSWETHILTAC